MDENVNGFDSEEEENNNIIVNEPLSIKYDDYETNKIIKFFQQMKLVKDSIRCEECTEIMKLEKNSAYIDNVCWLSRSKSPKHDIRKNIR